MANLLLVAFAILASIGSVVCNLDLLILHNNDIHSRFEETSRNSAVCKEENRNKTCIGGIARVAHEVRRYRQWAQEQNGTEVLYLNAGDTFVGTVWYNLFTWNISQEFINVLQPDAVTLGNHEFDAGVEGLAPFINALNCPIVSANLDFSNEPSITKVQKSVVIEKGGKSIGIIGHLTRDTTFISSPGKTIFSDEIESVRNESERLDSLGVKIIIVLGHSGFLKDQEIAEQVPLVDVVIGGHTNTFLWNGPQPDLEEIEGPYPTVVTQKSGKKVPVVQAYAYTKYLGRLNLTFDDNGDLIDFSGQPELLDSSIPQDEDVLQMLDKYRPKVVEVNSIVVGSSKVTLDGADSHCRHRECNFGNLLADAIVFYKASVSPEIWTEAPIGLWNGGGIRTTIESDQSRNITRGQLLGAIPFDNTIVTLQLNGSDLIKTLEIGVRGNGETSSGEFLQVSGLQVVFDRSKPAFSRVVSVKARCGTCEIPTYEDIVPSRNYTIVTIRFLAIGGDDHYVLDNIPDKKTEDLGDIDTVVWYLQHYSPVYPEVQGRIQFVDGNQAKGDSTMVHNSGLTLALVICINQFLL